MFRATRKCTPDAVLEPTLYGLRKNKPSGVGWSKVVHFSTGSIISQGNE